MLRAVRCTTVPTVPFGDLFRGDGTVVGEKRLCNFPCALDLNIEIDLTLGVITEDFAMQIPQIDNFIINQVIIEVMLTDFFLKERSGVRMQIVASYQSQHEDWFRRRLLSAASM